MTFNLKKALDKAAKNSGHKAANLIILGDMNTMGMNYEGRNHDIPGPNEIKVITNRFKRRKIVIPIQIWIMFLLPNISSLKMSLAQKQSMWVVGLRKIQLLKRISGLNSILTMVH